MTATDTTTLRIGHSPDPDDAFMWWPLANFVGPDDNRYTPKIDTKGYEFVHVLEDIQSLNVRSAKGELEITAISIHQYPYVADKYALTSCGSSMGDGYGPMIVAPRKLAVQELKGKKLAIPGEQTTTSCPPHSPARTTRTARPPSAGRTSPRSWSVASTSYW